MRRAVKVDANHGEIVEALLSVSGVKVHSLAGVGCGVPDLLVGAEGLTWLVEIKDGSKPPSHRSFTPDQQRGSRGGPAQRWWNSQARPRRGCGRGELRRHRAPTLIYSDRMTRSERRRRWCTDQTPRMPRGVGSKCGRGV